MHISYTFIKMQTVCGSTVYYQTFFVSFVSGGNELNLFCIIIHCPVFFSIETGNDLKQLL